jgi:dihydrolipoamide dehydrogenase
MTERHDVVIIGAGTAGLSALKAARKHTQDVLLIERGPYGTTCARVGCMPSKALIEAANAAHRRHAFDDFGIRGAEGIHVDLPAVLARVRRLRDHFVAGVLEATDRLGRQSVKGTAVLRGPTTVEVDGRRIEAGRIILATGSHPILPEPWARFGGRILTTDTLFEQETLPPRLAVIGMGAVGVELAQALARLGLEVTGFHAEETLAGIADPDINRTLCDRLRAEMTLHTGVEATVSEADAGRGDAGRAEAAGAPSGLGTTAATATAHTDGTGPLAVGSGDVRVLADRVLVAIGRRPNVAGLGLETLGVPLDDHGMPEVDPHSLQIADLPVFLAGDANGALPLQHEAADEGHIAGINATAPEVRRFRRRVPLTIGFTDPEVVTVGRRPGAGDASGEILTGSVDYATQGRARTAERNYGLIRVHAEAGSGRLLGAELCAPAADHMGHLLALAVQEGLTVHRMLRMPFYHPVLEEGLRTALRALQRQLPETDDRSDLVTCDPLDCEALE